MKKILVVEDEYYARKSIVKILQESDLDIQVCGEAANGMKAIELLEEYKDIALVITDIQMQKMGGLELASYLHKHIPEIDVLILTAFENFDYAREALRYNVKDYIVKPIYKENLLPPVKKVLEKQEEKSRNQEKIKNYYQWEAAKNYFPVKTIVAHEELYKEFFSYNAIHQEEKFCIVVMQEEELVTDVELVNRIIQEKYRGFIKDFFFSKINEEYVMLLSGIECMDNELIVQEKVESMLSYFCTCKHMNITMGVGLVYSSKEKIYQSYNEALYALNQRLIQGWNRAYFYKNMDGYKARIGKEAEIKLESIVRTRKEKEINQVIHSILEDIIIKEESAQKLYMAVVEILKILGNYYAELYQDEDIEELKDIKVMFSRRYDLYKFKHIEELENYLKEMVKVKDILTYATENKFGVAAINTLNIETVKYVIEAAERERVPIIVQFYPGFSDYTDLKHLAFAACDMAEKASIPVGVHLDHSVTYEIAVGGIRDGFPSVMIDGSTKSFQENVELTKNVVRVAKVFGVDVEAELGHVGNGDSIDAIDNTNYYTKVEDAVRFVEQTGCDSLARRRRLLSSERRLYGKKTAC